MSALGKFVSTVIGVAVAAGSIGLSSATAQASRMWCPGGSASNDAPGVGVSETFVVGASIGLNYGSVTVMEASPTSLTLVSVAPPTGVPWVQVSGMPASKVRIDFNYPGIQNVFTGELLIGGEHHVLKLIGHSRVCSALS